MTFIPFAEQDDYALVDGEMIKVVYMTMSEAQAEGWGFGNVGNFLTINETPDISSPTHVRVPDFVDGVPVRQIEASNPGTKFRGNENLTGITSLTLTTILNNGFDGCVNLEDVVLPSLTDLGSAVFSGCTSLTSLTLPSLKTAGANAFSSCTSLKSVILPELTVLSSQAFFECIELDNVELVMVESVSSQAFQGCSSLEKISLPNVESIGGSAFQLCSSLVSATLPKWSSIPDSNSAIFSGCSSLKYVLISNNFSIEPENMTNFFQSVPTDAVVLYKPGATGFGAFWPNADGPIGNDARAAIPDPKRWYGIIEDGDTIIRDGNTFESGKPWVDN